LARFISKHASLIIHSPDFKVKFNRKFDEKTRQLYGEYVTEDKKVIEYLRSKDHLCMEIKEPEAEPKKKKANK